MRNEITLSVEVPEVIETPVRIRVVCGATECQVYEHGCEGSGDWAAWEARGYVIGDGGTIGYTLERALQDAREYATTQERTRLLHAHLRDALATTEWEPADEDDPADEAES